MDTHRTREYCRSVYNIRRGERVVELEEPPQTIDHDAIDVVKYGFHEVVI